MEKFFSLVIFLISNLVLNLEPALASPDSLFEHSSVEIFALPVSMRTAPKVQEEKVREVLPREHTFVLNRISRLILFGRGFTKDEYDVLKKWEKEILDVGDELEWLKGKVAAPASDQIVMIRLLAQKVPALDLEWAIFAPLHDSQNKQSLLGSVLMPSAYQLGDPMGIALPLYTKIGPRKILILDSSQPPLWQSAIAVHEGMHYDQVEIGAAGQALRMGFQSLAGKDYLGHSGTWLTADLNEGYTQWKTLEVLQDVFNPSAQGTAFDLARTEFRKIMHLNPPDTANLLIQQSKMDQIYKDQRLLAEAIIKNWGEEPLRALLYRADPQPLLSQLGWRKVLLLSRLQGGFKGINDFFRAGNMGKKLHPTEMAIHLMQDSQAFEEIKEQYGSEVFSNMIEELIDDAIVPKGCMFPTKKEMNFFEKARKPATRRASQIATEIQGTLSLEKISWIEVYLQTPEAAREILVQRISPLLTSHAYPQLNCPGGRLGMGNKRE